MSTLSMLCYLRKPRMSQFSFSRIDWIQWFDLWKLLSAKDILQCFIIFNCPIWWASGDENLDDKDFNYFV